ncbi:MAG: MMPL family transporter, partial [Pseudomonadota bacterium]
RNVLLVVTSLASLVISIGITAGFASLVYEDMNLVSIAFLVLMVGLGIDFAIHLGLHIQEERCAGHKIRPAMYRTTRFVGAAIVLCAPTSALAFFAFSPTYFTGMAQLGIVSGFGVLVAFLVSITILPAVFAIKRRPPLRASNRIIEHSERAMRLPRIGWVRSAAAVLVLLLGFGALSLMPQVRFDADPMNLRDPSAQSVVSFDWLFEDENTQPFNLSILEADEASAVATAERLAELEVVKEVITLASFVPDEQLDKIDVIGWASLGLESVFLDAANSEAAEVGEPSPLDETLEGLRNSTDPASIKLLTSLESFLSASATNPGLATALEADVFRFWPRQYDRLQAIIYPEEITLETLPEALRERYIGNDGRWRVVIQPEADLRDGVARAAFVDAVRQADIRAAGSARSVLESGRVISRAMLIAVSLAMVTVTILLWVVLRDVTLVTVILFTLCLAGVLTAAAAVLLQVPFNFANVIALPLLIGVGADSGIHLGMRARRSDEAAQVYETSTPRAVFCSAMTTIVSFWTLSLSAHRGVQSMGILLTLAIAMTLICTLLVQPWLLERFGGMKRKNRDVEAVPA